MTSGIPEIPCAVPHTFWATCTYCKTIELFVVRCRLACECPSCHDLKVRALWSVYYPPIVARLRERQSVLEVVVRTGDPMALRRGARRALPRFECGDVGALATDDYDDDLEALVRFVILSPRDGAQRVLRHFDAEEVASAESIHRKADVAPALRRLVPFWGRTKTAQLRERYPDRIQLPHRKLGDTTERARRPRSFSAFGTLAKLGGISKGQQNIAQAARGGSISAEDFKICTTCQRPSAYRQAASNW